jgi:hypothetical protein
MTLAFWNQIISADEQLFITNNNIIKHKEFLNGEDTG